MDDKTLRALQLVQLEIAKEIKRICDENDIQYFLDSGTFLGAVRHGGFIPWDDDMDMGMLRSDFEKFVQIAPQALSDKYFLQTWDNDQNYPMAFAKVRKKDTLFKEAATKNTEHHSEIFVDIFPYDVYPMEQKDRNRQGKKIMRYRYMMMMKAGMTPWYRDKGMRRIMVFFKYQLYKFMSCFYKRDDLKKTLFQEITKYNTETSDNLYVGAGISKYGRWVIPARVFEKYTTMRFEDTDFSVVEDYDTYLSAVYGDYMTLPPLEKRVNHQIVEIKL